MVRYDNYVTNDKTKSLIRLLDKTAELSRCLGLSGAADQDIFDDYVYNQRLTGAVVVTRPWVSDPAVQRRRGYLHLLV